MPYLCGNAHMTGEFTKSSYEITLLDIPHGILITIGNLYPAYKHHIFDV